MSRLSFADRARRRTPEAGPLSEALRTPSSSGATAAVGQLRTWTPQARNGSIRPNAAAQGGPGSRQANVICQHPVARRRARSRSKKQTFALCRPPAVRVSRPQSEHSQRCDQPWLNRKSGFSVSASLGGGWRIRRGSLLRLGACSKGPSCFPAQCTARFRAHHPVSIDLHTHPDGVQFATPSVFGAVRPSTATESPSAWNKSTSALPISIPSEARPTSPSKP